jgi:hypothetical protein
MKTFLAGVAFAILTLASQASALPCPSTVSHGHYYACTTYDE